MSGRRADLGAFYFFRFGALGALLPFLPLLFEGRGLGPAEIGWVMMVVPVCGVLIPPLWGLLADARQAQVVLLRLATLGCALSVFLLLPDWGLWGALLGMFIFCFFRAPITSLIDTIAHAELAEPSDFPKIRLWGSIGFIVSVELMGRLQGASRPLVLLGVAALAYLLAALSSARLSGAALKPKGHGALSEAVMAAPGLGLLLLGNLLYYAGHSVLDGYLGLHARALGHSDEFIGRAWALGVIAETVVMFLAPRFSILAPGARWPILAACALVAALRWLGLSIAKAPLEILAIQTLHGVTFGLWYISMVGAVQQRAPQGLKTSMQALAQAALGLGAALGYLIAGPIFEAQGGAGAFRFAAVAALLSSVFYAADRLRA